MHTYTTEFTLNREYLAECYDESLAHGKNAKPNFLFPAALLIVGSGILALTDHPRSLGILFIVLGLIELLHIRFRRAWWLTRQMWGKTGGSEITLVIDEAGIETKSPYNQTTLTWADVDRVIETDLGIILVTKAGAQQYLSKSLFSDEAIQDITTACNA